MLCCLLLTLLMTVFGDFLFGDKLFLFKDIGSDTLNVYFPQLVHIAEYLHTVGIPKWSFQQGLGQNILPLSLGDPFNWILYLMGGQSLAFGIVWVEVLKMFLAGMLFYGFLRERGLGNYAATIGGILYPFTGFMLIGAGWYIFTSQGALMALMLWGFERFFQKKSWWMFTLSVFLVAMNMVFDLYLLGTFVLIYAALRCLEEDWTADRIVRLYTSIACYGVLGLLMSSFLLVSTVEQILNSPRVSGESAFFATLMARSPYSLVDAAQHASIWGRLFSNDFFHGGGYEIKAGAYELLYKGAYNYLEAPALYCGLSILLLLPQVLLHLSRKKRIIYIAGLGLLLLPLFFPFLRNTLWLYSGDYYRVFSLFVSIGLMIWGLHSLDLISKKGHVNLVLLGATFGFWLIIMFAPFYGTPGIVVNTGILPILVGFLIFHAAAIAMMHWQAYRHAAAIALLVLISLEAMYMGANTYSSQRATVSKSEFTQQKVGYNDHTKDALTLIKQKDATPFYRIEKIGYYSSGAMHRSLNDSKAQGYYASPSYHSFNQKNYIRFLAELDIIDPKDENQTRWSPGVVTRPLIQLLTSTKYTLTSGEVPRFWHIHLANVGNIDVLYDPYFLPFGFTYNAIISERVFSQLSKANESLEKQVALLKALAVAPADMIAFEQLPVIDAASFDANYTSALLEADANRLREEVLEISEFSQNHIEGNITLAKPKALFFSIPHDSSWKVLVNGHEVPFYRANLGFIALPLPQGQHKVELYFEPPYWTASLLASGSGCILYLGMLLWTGIRRKLELLA